MIFMKKQALIVTSDIKESAEDEEFNSYDFSNMEFGFDAMSAEEDDYEFNTVEEYDKREASDDEELNNYIKFREPIMDDAEIDNLISRYLLIKDRKSNAFRQVFGIIKDFRRAVIESGKKHGNVIFDTDEKDEEKDKVRMMTKAEATLIIDNTLSQNLPTYLLAFEHFRRDTFKIISFSLGICIILALMTFSAFITLVPITGLLTFVSIGNIMALFRDMQRTKLVVIKEIDRIHATVRSLDQKKDKEKIIMLTSIADALIKSSGYTKDSKVYKKLHDPEVVKKIMESIDYFGDEYTFKDIEINILEDGLESALSANLSGADSGSTPAPEADTQNTEEPAEENANDGNNDSAEEPAPEDGDGYGGANMQAEIDDPDNNMFDDNTDDGDAEGNELEKRRKLKYCLDNLDLLRDKYKALYTDFVDSDIYRVMNQDLENKSRKNMLLVIHELEIALHSLEDYIAAGDKSSYSIVALKLSSFQTLLKGIDNLLYQYTVKDSEEDITK